MFVQVIQGSTSDTAGLRRQFDHWVEELASDAPGWLGFTGGVTDDGEFVGAVRFASQDDARRNSDRAEQGRWWQDTAPLFDGEVTFRDCTEVDEWMGGPSDTAGFVQVIQATVSDPARYRELMQDAAEMMASLRPDITGGLSAWQDGGGLTQVVTFTDEPSAREGERRALPPEVTARVEEQMGLVSDLRYLDLRDPWHYSR